MNNELTDIELVLVSHTNNGKTTLTRTLLGDDVGEVRDAAHVTQSSEAHTLLTSQAGDRLQLWDTPGFGDSVRLLKRLDNTDNPIGWFLREVLDRYRDRPFWLSQQALRTARDACDIVLYLVNASESPEDAGYVASEMKILAWLGKPVLVLLNQVGPPQPVASEQAEVSRWRVALESYHLVRDVLPLDAFARCWVHERVFYQALGTIVPEQKAASHARLIQTWDTLNATRFAEAMAIMAKHLSAAATAQETIVFTKRTGLKSALRSVTAAWREAKSNSIGNDTAKGELDDQGRAMQRLAEKLDGNIARTTISLLGIYHINAGAAGSINARLKDNFAIHAPIGKVQAGLLGALISGATTGLTADLVSGGLTVGLGAVLGGVMGALTFAGAAWGFNATTHRQVPRVQFSPALLRTLTSTSVLRYLAIIHFGRGRGHFIEGEAPLFWLDHVEQAVAINDQSLAEIWQLLHGDGMRSQGEALLGKTITAITTHVLQGLYPDGAFERLH